MIDATRRRDRAVLELAAKTFARILRDAGQDEAAAVLGLLRLDLVMGETSAMVFVDDVSLIVSAELEGRLSR